MMDIFSRRPPPAGARIPYGPDPLNFGDLRLPRDPASEVGGRLLPVVVLVHGGFWRAQYSLEHIGHAAAALAAEGVAVWSLEYRRIGNPGGGWPGTFLDVGAGVDHLRELAPFYNLDLARVVAVGHSAGGHLAAWAAARHTIPQGDPLYTDRPLPLRAVVPLASVVDLRRAWELVLSNNVVEEFMGGAPDALPHRYKTASPIEMLPLGIPQTLVHGAADENVPLEISERYVEAAQEQGDEARLIALPRAGHFEVIDPRSTEWPQALGAIMGLV